MWKKLLKNNLTLAVLASLGVHLFFIAAVDVATPEDLFRSEPFTRVTFLGPILEKTAFDIMVGTESLGMTVGRIFPLEGLAEMKLEIPLPGTEHITGVFPQFREKETYELSKRYSFFKKVTPDILGLSGISDTGSFRSARSHGIDASDWVVKNRPSPPVVIRGIYGDGKYFTVGIGGIIDELGNVAEAHIIRTSGYSFVDMEALKYFREWQFDLSRETDKEKKIEVVITVYTVSDVNQ